MEQAIVQYFISRDEDTKIKEKHRVKVKIPILDPYTHPHYLAQHQIPGYPKNKKRKKKRRQQYPGFIPGDPVLVHRRHPRRPRNNFGAAPVIGGFY